MPSKMGDIDGDIEEERLKVLREKESWEIDKKKLQQELEVEKLVGEPLPPPPPPPKKKKNTTTQYY